MFMMFGYLLFSGKCKAPFTDPTIAFTRKRRLKLVYQVECFDPKHFDFPVGVVLNNLISFKISMDSQRV